jgi:hypothetical protein
LSVQFLGGNSELLEFLLEASLVVFDVRELEPLVGQLGLGFRADLAQLLDTPLERFQFGFDVDGRLQSGLGLGFADGVVFAIARKRVQEHQQRSERADHGIQKGKHLDAACGCAFLHDLPLDARIAGGGMRFARAIPAAPAQ